MLMQNFRTAKELGISEQEHEALIGVLGMLERGELVHVPLDGVSITRTANYQFNMGEYDCGSVKCIAGWCDALYDTQFKLNEPTLICCRMISRGDELYDLFYGEEGECWIDRLESITAAQAAQALRNYLTDGSPHWSDIVKMESPDSSLVLVEWARGGNANG